MKTYQSVEGAKSGGVAFMLSLIFPGLGHFYIGRVGRAIATMLGTWLVMPLIVVLFMLPFGTYALWIVPTWWLGLALEAASMAGRVGRCPECREPINRKARRCPHCRTAFDAFGLA